jgi:hypothetical protein
MKVTKIIPQIMRISFKTSPRYFQNIIIHNKYITFWGNKQGIIIVCRTRISLKGKSFLILMFYCDTFNMAIY